MQILMPRGTLQGTHRENDWCVGDSTGAVSLPQSPWRGRPQPLLACPQWWGDHPFLCPSSPSWSSVKRVFSTCTLELTPAASCLFPNSTQRLRYPLSPLCRWGSRTRYAPRLTMTESALSTMGKPNFLSLFFIFLSIMVYYRILNIVPSALQ